jgi:uncharacterized delta-60 repeat protein
VVAGGTFSAAQPNGGTTAFTRNYIARFNTDGTLDQNFDPNPNSTVSALAALGTGQILVGGSFTTLQPRGTGTIFTRNNLARVNSDSAVDDSFNPNPNAAVTSISVQPDGQIVIGGSFTTVQPNASGAAITRNHLARIAANGALDPNFNPDVNGAVSLVAARPDGTVLVGGTFTDLQLNGSIVVAGNFANIGGVAARNLALLNDNGSVNATFQPRPDGVVNALLVQADGKVVAGGAFTTIAGATRTRIARFNADGTLDTAFNPAVSASSVTALALQPDRKILVGGAGPALVRLNPDGTLDPSFVVPTVAGITATVGGLAVQADGKILVLATGNGLVRLNADGSPDTTFTPFLASPLTMALQADGRILVGTDTRIVRLNANGANDATFTVVVNGRVSAVALQSDGRAVIGGGFTTIGGQPHVGIGRIAATAPAVQVLGVAANRTGVIWNRAGTTGEISAVIFELSTDRLTWTRLGEGNRVANSSNWQLSGLNLPATGVFYIRARAIAPSSGSRSSGLYETVREFTYSSPLPPEGPVIAGTPGTAGAVIDPVTGIVPRSAITSVAGEGTVEIFVSSAVQAPANPRPARLANLSTRGRVSADSPLILGFAIAGSDSHRVLVRAVGPGLNAFGVSGALPAARLQVYDASGAVIATNDGWAGAADLAQTAAVTGAFPLSAGSADSAAVLTLAPGNYTLQVVDSRGTGGVALAEIYDADAAAGSRLVNVSSRGAAASGNGALISGFVIAGDASERVLLRAVGPGLARFNTTGVVTDPAIALFDAEGRELGGNDNWVSSIDVISAAAAASGAFPLQAGSRDAAVLATLPSGAYTIQVTAPNAGAALLEIYEVR